jgi:NADPH:quinone reductase-like Zn-dependent oxidoreductase
MTVEQLPDPPPGPGQVVLEVRAAALNHLDLYARAQHAAEASSPPKIIGSDAAGVVAALGKGVDTVCLGDEVILDPGLSCGRCPRCEEGEESECREFDIVGRGVPGTLAERVVVPATNLAPKPPHLSFDQAAALPLAHMTAWRMVMTRGQLREGETVLIHGIGGGVALAALQIAKLAGARVIVTSSSAAKLTRARELGADETIDYRDTPEVAAAARRGDSAHGVDLVVDTVGAATLGASIAAVRNGGRVVVCGATTGAEVRVNLREIFWRQIAIFGSTMGSRADFRSMVAAVTRAGTVPVIDGVLHLSQAGAALDRLASEHQFGKIVLSATAEGGRPEAG